MAGRVPGALNDPAALDTTTLWIGTSTAELGGSGHGIERVRVNDSSAPKHEPPIPAHSPSFLAAHPALPVLYAVEESTGNLVVLDVARESVRWLGPPQYACELPCHIHVDPRGRYLVVSGWGDGTIALFDLSPDGRPLLRDRVGLEGTVPPRAHSATTVREGKIATVDIANDSICFWRLDETEGMVSEYALDLPAMSGPRHLKVHGDGLVYVVTEYSGCVFVLRAGRAGRFTIAGSAPLRPHGTWSRTDLAAEITITDLGSATFAHVGVRGSDTIVTMRVAPNRTDLVAIDEVSCHGITPRHHTTVGSRLYVANRASNSIAVFQLGPSGLPTHRGDVDVGSPSCVVVMNDDVPAGPLRRGDSLGARIRHS
ncbi:lactonase family protein [Herbiconiux ginsengi]|uniref:6-phosphogluconolactonase, cycloisomerase 2 family n=1 Tax=Herbiconiux ginsengi TaxID=381665 RepID=A0A1H3LI62_9MICO|nr:beta-propeller fold lactonase family protein [Herbiconiux ginsengi]SDY64083.1 6-phosphogluconolactonase, cycloisomerase 2 family [Herbiconiux ginsengi]